MKKIFLSVMRGLSRVIKKDRKLITLIFNGYSGSNLNPIIEKLKEERYNDYNVNIIDDRKLYTDYKNKKIGKLDLYRGILRKYKSILKSHILISTHGSIRLRNDTTMINLWHGIPIKSMSLMNKSKMDAVNVIKDDYFISTSDFFNTIVNSCFGLTIDKYYITGYPRNDYLFTEDGVKNLNKLLEKNVKGNIILFTPTYRYNRTKKDFGDNLFGFSDFDKKQFNEFLENNNITLLLKVHPNDEKVLIDSENKNRNGRIILISNSDLESKEMDLYKILNSVDLLITDYSSICFDYLLLDRPIIFTPVDLEHYRDKRGFLLEPYEFWTPGPKCLSQQSLHEEIIKSLNNNKYYKNERETIKNIMHKYKDDNSTDRVMALIESLMKG